MQILLLAFVNTVLEHYVNDWLFPPEGFARRHPVIVTVAMLMVVRYLNSTNRNNG